MSTLERDGPVIKARAPHDGRAVNLSLTDSGLRAITTAFQAHTEREQQWAGSLSTDEQQTLIALSEMLTAHSVHFAVKQRE
ncbi:hypothetical protein [Nocardiopsis sp. NRRL B-16309]|uniref:MarR family winged helix-turn-helix transcriptional regulator n=1 Tax=Nocardiopsis sp. NRRL B-16309 TaxID=1519494 RepID=UPI0012E2DEDC